jgi:hypothetical protein
MARRKKANKGAGKANGEQGAQLNAGIKSRHTQTVKMPRAVKKTKNDGGMDKPCDVTTPFTTAAET